MTEKEKNDFFYVCALIEFTARKTRNKRGVIVRAMGEEGVKKELYDAEVNHCLSFEQVNDEISKSQLFGMVLSGGKAFRINCLAEVNLRDIRKKMIQEGHIWIIKIM